jgi:hypothetical protein
MNPTRTFSQETPISGRDVEVHWLDEEDQEHGAKGEFNEVNGRFTVGGIDVEFASCNGGTWVYL